MAEIVENFQPQRGRPEKYDWDKLTDGRARRLIQGKDFDAELLSFRTMVHRKARDLGIRVSTKINRADTSITIQFITD